MVPFAKGDEDGSFTSELVSTLSSSGLGTVLHRHADYRLEVAILNDRNETIGFRRDPQKIENKVKKNLLAIEGRKIIEVEATVYRETSDEIVFGPYRLTAEADYDYIDGDSLQELTFSYNGKLVSVLPFSLGQLEPIESAVEAATKPIYRRLSQKIVDVISSEW
ncbi:MAG: hypothetical protein KGJ02_03065 [Verrucomicrobiota bacterium]|nr:hypothetical protein [Verrucomicrobiota bacterium]